MGTTGAYFDHYRYGAKRPLRLAQGARFTKTFDAVIGADVARVLGYQLGDTFPIAHGIQSAGFAEHKGRPFRVAGVLAPTGTPVDRTVHISLAGLEAVHLGWNNGAPPPGTAIGTGTAREIKPEDLEPKSVTAFLVGLKTRVAVLGYQRRVNTYRQEALTGVIPGVALAQLWRVVGSAEHALRAVALFVVIAVLIGLLTTILTSLNERRREIAVFRAVGAGARDVFFLLILESTLVAGLGALVGAIFVNAGFIIAGRVIETSISIPLGNLAISGQDVVVIAGVTGLGLLLGLLPGWMAYRRSLSDGLTIRI